MLFKAVAHIEAVAGNLLHLLLHTVEVAAGLQAQLQRREHALLLEQAAGKAYGCDNVVLVVLRLSHVENHSGRIQLVGHETVGGVCHVELTFAPRGIDLQRPVEACPRSQLVGKA